MDEMTEIMKALNSSEFRVLFENKLIDEIQVRNFFIRAEYQNAKERGEQKEAIKERLADKENLAFISVKKILSSNNYKKKPIFHSFAELEKKIRE